MKLAIVGSQGKSWTSEGLYYAIGAAISTAIILLEPTEIVSGESPGRGVDALAREYAAFLKIPFKGFPPAGNTWGEFKARNIEIAEYCDQLIAIRSLRSKTYGSGWTADYAEKIGKPVFRIQF